MNILTTSMKKRSIVFLMTAIILSLVVFSFGISINKALAYGGASVGGGGGGIRQCNDAKDNDGDGLFDYPNDPDCSGYFDDSEGASVAPSTTGGASVNSAVTVLQQAAVSPIYALTLMTTSEIATERSDITAQVTKVVGAVSSLMNSGQIATYKNLAISAVKQTLRRLIAHTINYITLRIAVLAAQ